MLCGREKAVTAISLTSQRPGDEREYGSKSHPFIIILMQHLTLQHPGTSQSLLMNAIGRRKGGLLLFKNPRRCISVGLESSNCNVPHEHKLLTSSPIYPLERRSASFKSSAFRSDLYDCHCGAVRSSSRGSLAKRPSTVGEITGIVAE